MHLYSGHQPRTIAYSLSFQTVDRRMIGTNLWRALPLRVNARRFEDTAGLVIEFDLPEVHRPRRESHKGPETGSDMIDACRDSVRWLETAIIQRHPCW